jgi:hypothetical protein
MAATLIVLAKLFATTLMPATCSNNFFTAKNTFCSHFALSLPKTTFLVVSIEKLYCIQPQILLLATNYFITVQDRTMKQKIELYI